VEVESLKNSVGAFVRVFDDFFFAFGFFFAAALADPMRPPCDRLQLRWAMPAPSRPGVRSPVSASGGSWSALAPCGSVRGRAMSTGYPQRMQTGSHLARTWRVHAR
jgi:hypothetical protein